MTLALSAPTGLTPRQLAFVERFLDLGGRNQGKAARLAGYSDTSADAHASRLLRHPAVLAELKRLSITRLTSETLRSVVVLAEIRDDLLADAGVRLRAAGTILDRSGIIAATLARHEIDVTVHDDSRTVIASILAMCQEMGIDPKGLLHGGANFFGPGHAKPRPAVDAQFAEVDPDDVTDNADPDGGTIGERILPPPEIIGRSAVQEAPGPASAPTPAPAALAPRRGPGRSRTAGSVPTKPKPKGRLRKVQPVPFDDLSDVLGPTC